MAQVFVPGFGAPAEVYERALDATWNVHRPPTFRAGPSLASRVIALQSTVDFWPPPVRLAGHSMGAALAVAVALEQATSIERLILLAPAGLPLVKPIHESMRDFGRQIGAGLYRWDELAHGVGAVARAPRASLRLARVVRALDLSDELREIKRCRIPCEVIGCTSDTLTPVSHCRRIAELAGARYSEVDVPGGHMWMFADPATLARVLTG